MNSKIKGRILVFMAVLSFSTTGLFIKILTLSGMGIVGIRCLLAMLVHIVYMAVRGRKPVFNLPTIAGAVCIALDLSLYTISAKLTAATNAVVLENTAPVFVILIMLICFGVRPTKKDLAVMAGVFAGILIYFVDGLSAGNLAGNMIAVCSGFFYAVMIMMSRIKGCDTPSAYIYGFAMAAAAGLPASVRGLSECEPTGALIFALLFIGIVQGGLAYVFLDAGTKLIPPFEASLICALDPILNSTLVMAFAGERLTPLSAIGAVTVLLFILWYTDVIGSRRGAGSVPDK